MPEPIFVEASTSGSEPFPDRTTATAPTRVLISIPVNDDGSPDWSRVKDKTRDKFREICADPSTQSLLGKEEAEAAPAPKELADAAVGMYFQTMAMTFAVTKKIPLPLASQLFRLTNEEHEKLDPLAQQVLGKYLPEWLARFGPEIALTKVLIDVTLIKYAGANKVAAEWKAAHEKPVQKGNNEPKGTEIPAYREEQPLVA